MVPANCTIWMLENSGQLLGGHGILHPFDAQFDQELEPLSINSILDTARLGFTGGPTPNRPFQPRVLEFGGLPIDRAESLLHGCRRLAGRDDTVRGLPLPCGQEILDVAGTAIEVMVERPLGALQPFTKCVHGESPITLAGQDAEAFFDPVLP